MRLALLLVSEKTRSDCRFGDFSDAILDEDVLACERAFDAQRARLLSDAERSALFIAIGQHADLADSMSVRVTPALFPAVAAHVNVQRLMPGGLKEAHRDYVRRVLRCDIAGVSCQRSVLATDAQAVATLQACFKSPVCFKTLSSLWRDAKGTHCGASSCRSGAWCRSEACVPQCERSRAIRILCEWFPIDCRR